MQASAEHPRVRWAVMIATWLLAGTLLFMHAATMRAYLDNVGKLGLRGQPASVTPLKMAYPSFAIDAQTWVRHALTLVESDQVRLRYTTIDNAPKGREVHWNSAWAWAIVAAGKINQSITGKPLPEAIEAATVWLPPTAFTLLIVVVSGWVARRGGALAGVFIALAMVGHQRVFEGFFPTYVDHHGLLTVAAMAVALAAAFMGAGWWRAAAPGEATLFPPSPEAARQAAVASGIAGAFGMWVSAASSIPPIAIVGIAGLVTIFVQKREGPGEGLQFDPEVWRTWGRTGALVSFGFYLLEYFPNHLALRLEPNHPFHSLAWLGGGELIAQAGEYWFGTWGSRPRAKLRLGGALAAVALAPLAILLGGAAVFEVADPFMVNLHKNIQEFLPLWRTIQAAGWRAFFNIMGAESLVVVAGIGLLWLRGRRCPPVVWFTVVTAFGFTMMAWYQSRWMLNASGPQIVLAWVLVVYLVGTRPLVVRWGVGLVLVGTLFFPSAVLRVTRAQSDVRTRTVATKDALEMVFRDIATALRASSPNQEVVLLSSPNTSSGVGYYGRVGTLGTLYWENAEGLKKAAALHSEPNLDTAKELFRKYGVTHVAIVSEENFIEPYFRLLHPGASDDDVKKSLGYQILGSRAFPIWLQMIPYALPDDLKDLKLTVYLFKVALEQNSAEALYHIALGKVALGMTADAEADFETLIRDVPASPLPWMRKSELFIARGDWPAAIDALVNGIQRSAPDQRLAMYANAAANLYRERQFAGAIRLYRAALDERFVPEVAADLAFVLSTTRQDALRDGVAAEELANRAVAANPESIPFLNSLATAQAERGRFDEAVATAERALTLARQRGDATATAVSEQRLALFKLRQPARE